MRIQDAAAEAVSAHEAAQTPSTVRRVFSDESLSIIPPGEGYYVIPRPRPGMI